jgi:digeranylgeranylglycerophospholipid reductase
MEELIMAKKYDVIVVGAGPAGFLAAKAAGENGLEVALLEKRTDPTQLTRACGQTLVSMNEPYFGNIVGYNARDKRMFFPSDGFSFKYDGPYQNLYCLHMYAPSGHRVEMGDLNERRGMGDRGRVGIAFDKEVLFRCFMEEVGACGVDVFPGINVQDVTPSADGVIAKGSDQSFEARYLIAADGVNSRVAEVMGFNKDRHYYCNLYALHYYMSGMEPPASNVIIISNAYMKDGVASFFIFPRPTEGNHQLAAITLNPKLDLEATLNFVMTEAFCAPWFKNAKKMKTLSAVCNCYKPIIEPYKDRVILTGDVGSTQELEITGAMASGWKAGQAVSTAIQEENLGLEVTGTAQYINWWKDAYINYYDHEIYMKGLARSYMLGTEEATNYFFGLINEKLPAVWNPYSSPTGEIMKRILPILQQERPDILQKLQKAALPFSEIIADITKISKPVS